MSEIDAVVTATVQRLGCRPTTAQWAACAMIWSRWWVLASDGWARWPHAAERVFDGLQVCLARAGRLGGHLSDEIVLAGLEALDVEDDGSPEWQYMVDLAAMLSEALNGVGSSEAVESTIRTFLEGVFNVLANAIAMRSGRSISQAMAAEEIGNSAEWKESLALVTAL